MTEVKSETENDCVRRFMFEGANVRGVIVRLGDAWRQIRERDNYPLPIASALGQMAAASALLAGDIGMDGSIMTGKVSVQLRGGEVLSLGFVECTSSGSLRGLARWTADERAPFAADALQHAILAITIERDHAAPPQSGQSQSAHRYQGLVPLEGGSLGQCLENYFLASEQLPTVIHLFSHDDQAAGLLLQQIPAEGGLRSEHDALTFEHACTLAATITAEELYSLDAETILRRLFSEDDLRLFEPLPLRFACSCSNERVANMLSALGREEAFAAIGPEGLVEVHCEFCNQRYTFDAVDLEQALRGDSTAPGSPLAQ
ncbi:MAG: Hsp33 family molecular chaperone HslO [Pseudomonadota bacterium]|nr:Hsp33 family molecular chaperone HslO [Pseudomonadota bacterium]